MASVSTWSLVLVTMAHFSYWPVPVFFLCLAFFCYQFIPRSRFCLLIHSKPKQLDHDLLSFLSLPASKPILHSLPPSPSLRGRGCSPLSKSNPVFFSLYLSSLSCPWTRSFPSSIWIVNLFHSALKVCSRKSPDCAGIAKILSLVSWCRPLAYLLLRFNQWQGKGWHQGSVRVKSSHQGCQW